MIVGSLISVAWDTGGNIFTDSLGRLWKRADGSNLAIASYPDLYAVIGTRYGSPSAGEFKLPNFTARFLRGWDPTASVDIDAAARTIPGPGSTSADAGTVQPEIIRSHSHYAFPAGRFHGAPPGTAANPGAGQVYGAGPTYPSTRSATTISGYTPTNLSTFTPGAVLPYHMVVDFLIRIK